MNSVHFIILPILMPCKEVLSYCCDAPSSNLPYYLPDIYPFCLYERWLVIIFTSNKCVRLVCVIKMGLEGERKP